MANIRFRKERIIPTKTVLVEGFWIGLSVSILAFVVDFFGLGFLLNPIPDGFRIFTFVLLGVYLRGLFDIKVFGREVI